MGAGGLQVGRSSEREQLAAVLRDSAAGRPGAVLVAGEAGIGKTDLVREVTAGPAASGHLVLWGRCLRFGAESTPYLPIGQILTQWYRHADPAERTRVLAGAEHLASIAPRLGGTSGPADAARVLPLVASALDRIAETAPLALVVDDAQWADGSSLDLLAYLMAGLGEGQRLCLLVTYRDTDLGEGHRLHGWLADAARLPSVSRVRLERLGFADVDELVDRMRDDGDGSSRTTDEVFAKAGGNPYYTELLVRGRADRADPEADDGLRQALLSSWHRLGADARVLMQLLAVGGRPVAVDVLTRLAEARGGTPDQVTASLAEATSEGLVTLVRDGDVWFHHPLIAEVVAATLSPTARKLVHRQYVDVLESSAALTSASRAALLALHHDRAGDPDQAFVWSLRAADAAAKVRGYAEVCDHLHRACRLWDHVDEDVRTGAGDRLDLWLRASDSARSAGEYLLAVRLREEAIAREGEEHGDPVQALRLRLPLYEWRVECGLDAGERVEDRRRVVELAEAGCPGTPEHAQALARLAHAEAWAEDVAAATLHAASAVRMARRTGSSEALAWALCARAETPPYHRNLEHATQALALARGVGDPWLLGFAATRTANRLGGIGRPEKAAEVLLTTFRQLVADGSVHDAMNAGPAYGASILLELGRWEEAREVLRLLLSHRLFAGMGALARGVAASLAVRTGDVAAGRTHLARARELQPRSSRAGEILEHIEVEAQADMGHSREALSLATQLMPALAPGAAMDADELLVVAARAAGDLAEHDGERDRASALLERLVELAGGSQRPLFVQHSADDLIHPARRALFAADRARCHGAEDTAALWREAVAKCGTAGMKWHESLASYRLARALLAERGPRTEAASALRHAARIATDLGAGPILRDVEELARQAHVSLTDPVPTRQVPGTDDRLTSLTAREREVLSHLVAGRTYAEIARDLFISEKTVSVHVSNLLRKTGTRSRLEVAQLARRTSGPA